MSAINPITELVCYLTGWNAVARSKRRFSELLGVEAAQDIATDAVQHQRGIAASAYDAEQADLQAAKLLEEASKDGLTEADMPAIAAAIRHIRASAKKDRQINEAATL
jgi:hypothetical protein